MPHFPKPFFRTARNAWFVQVGPRQINLGVDKDEAFSRYHELMAKPALPVVTATEAARLVAVVTDDFLDYVQQHQGSTLRCAIPSLLVA